MYALNMRDISPANYFQEDLIMRTTLIATLTCTLIVCLGLVTLPATGETKAEPSSDLAMTMAPTTVVPTADSTLLPEVIVSTGRTTAQAVSSCVEPSPCQTHADCDFPSGFCLPSLGNPNLPSPKSCACLPDNF